MQKLASILAAGAIAVALAAPAAFAQDQKKEQVHKGTPEQGTVQKHKKTQKKDGSGKKKAAPAATDKK
jgi:hypothetical protein